MKVFFRRSILGLSPAFFALFLLSGLLFVLNPQWDLDFSALFFLPDGNFAWHGNTFGYIIYRGVHYVTTALVVFYAVYLGLSFWLKNKHLWGISRRSVIYMAVVLALGPGLMVNTVLKENVGRARPADVTCFAGESQFTPAFVISGECDGNCSFTSGHAAFGFYWTALGFIAITTFRRRLGFTFGVIMGAAIGLMRIAQGRHFLSDVVFSFFFVYMVAAIVWWVFDKKFPPLQKSR